MSEADYIKKLEEENRLLKDQVNKISGSSHLISEDKTIASTALDGFWIIDLYARFKEVNDIYLGMTGYTREEFLKLSVNDVEAVENASDIQQHIEKIVRQGADRFETSHRRKDGSEFSVEISIHYLPSNGGELYCFLRNITKIKSTERELKESQTRFEKMFYKHNAVMLIIDPETKMILDGNEAAVSFYGYPLEKLKTMHLSDINISPPEIIHEAVLNASLRERQYFVLRHKIASGEKKWVEIYSAPFNSGNKQLLFSVIHDITARKEAELALQESQTRYKMVTELVTDYLFKIKVENDRNIQLIYASDNFEKITGRSLKEASDMSQWAKIFYPEDLPAVNNFIKQVITEGEKGEIECRSLSNNAIRWISITAKPEKDEITGKVAFITGAVKDISERKNTEEKLRLSEEKFYKAFMTTPDAVSIVSAITNQYIDVNENFIKISGYSRDEIVGKSTDQINKWAREEEKIEMMRVFKQDRRLKNFEIQAVIRTGEIKEFSVSAELITINGELCYLFMIRDITVAKQNERALESQSKRYKLLMQTAMDAICVLDPAGNLHEWNDAFLKHLGYTTDELKLLNLKDWDIDFLNKPETSNLFLKLMKSGITIESRHLRKDGTILDVEITAKGVTIEGKDYIYSSSRDITQRKIAEKALRMSQFSIDKAMDGIFWTERNARFIYVNEKACSSLGYTKNELLTLKLWDIDPVYPKDQWDKRWESYGLHRETVSEHFESFHRRKDGTIFPVEISSQHIWFGEVELHVAYVRDITERKKASEELKASEEKFRSLFENITEGVAIHDVVYDNEGFPTDCSIIDANQAFNEMVGLEVEKAIFSLKTNLNNNDSRIYFDEFAKIADTGNAKKFEIYVPALDKHFNISVIAPKKGQFATVYEDISERIKREEELKQKNEELTTFIYTVSHDLKSPLVTIKSFAHLLQEDIQNQDTEAQEKDLGYIHNATDKMGRLLDELLELSRIGRKENPKSEVMLSTIAQSAIDLVAGRIKQRNVKVNIVGPPVMLHGDPQRLTQLYQNLVDNAVKFMGDEPKPLIEIGALHEKKDNMEVVLFVRDNGRGIEPRYHHKIFGLFEKLDVNTEGTGIGLTLVKRIIEVHGGSIWFTSDHSRKGTTFYFTLANSRIIA